MLVCVLYYIKKLIANTLKVYLSTLAFLLHQLSSMQKISEICSEVFFFSVNFNKIYIKKNSINVSQNFMRTREVKKKLEGSKKNCQVLLLALLHLGRPSIYLTSMMYKTVQIILKLRLPSYWIPRAPYKIIKILLSTI
jgi:type III secretory pathway component EscU